MKNHLNRPKHENKNVLVRKKIMLDRITDHFNMQKPLFLMFLAISLISNKIVLFSFIIFIVMVLTSFNGFNKFYANFNFEFFTV